jgi:SAM-dependent methyltransferase
MHDNLSAFVREYQVIRAREGHGFGTAEELLRLPDVQSGHQHEEIWRIRRRTFAALVTRVLSQFQRPMRVLDLGAGVGWLSYRLAELGHSPVAIDVNPDHRDGLGAAEIYGCPRVLADFDRLPFSDGSADLAIFNGSFHYSADYSSTLQEALRVASCVAIMDSPIYQDPKSGQMMVLEQRASRSSAIACKQFLTYRDLDELGRELSVRWEIVRPWYGIRWAARPLISRLRQRREPAQFAILVAAR